MWCILILANVIFTTAGILSSSSALFVFSLVTGLLMILKVGSPANKGPRPGPILEDIDRIEGTVDPRNSFCVCLEVHVPGRYESVVSGEATEQLGRRICDEVLLLLDTKRIYRRSDTCFLLFKQFPKECRDAGERQVHISWVAGSISKVCEDITREFDHLHLRLSTVHVALAGPGVHYPCPGTDQLISLALYTLHQAKVRNVVSLTSDDVLRAQLRDIDEFSIALSKRETSLEFFPYFQPLITAEGYMVAGCEAFARWNKDTYRIIPASEFKDIARTMNLLDQIDRIIFRKSLALFKRLKNLQIASGEFLLVVNISCESLKNSSARMFSDLAYQYGVGPENIEFDINGSLLQDTDAKDALRRLQDEGFRIALDIFNSESFNLRSLYIHTIDTLKIDLCDLSATTPIREESQVRILHMLAAMARENGIRVVAKGIEHGRAFHLARALGSHSLQGQYITRELSGEGLITFCKKYRQGIPLDQSMSVDGSASWLNG